MNSEKSSQNAVFCGKQLSELATKLLSPLYNVEKSLHVITLPELKCLYVRFA
jgi:hypothetical protein